MSKRREQRPMSRKERRALRELERAENALFDAYLCDDMGEGFEEPTVEDMLQSGEGQLPDR